MPLLSLSIYILCDQLSVDLSREQRSLGKQSLLYSQVLERENHCTLRRGHMGGGPGKWIQPSRWGAKRGDPWTKWTSTFMEGQDGVHMNSEKRVGLDVGLQLVLPACSGSGISYPQTGQVTLKETLTKRQYSKSPTYE